MQPGPISREDSLHGSLARTNKALRDDDGDADPTSLTGTRWSRATIPHYLRDLVSHPPLNPSPSLRTDEYPWTSWTLPREVDEERDARNCREPPNYRSRPGPCHLDATRDGDDGDEGETIRRDRVYTCCEVTDVAAVGRDRFRRSRLTRVTLITILATDLSCEFEGLEYTGLRGDRLVDRTYRVDPPRPDVYLYRSLDLARARARARASLLLGASRVRGEREGR